MYVVLTIYLVRFSSAFKTLNENDDGPENGSNDLSSPFQGKSYLTFNDNPNGLLKSSKVFS